MMPLDVIICYLESECESGTEINIKGSAYIDIEGEI
jgi:hypothetical protein